MTEILLGLSLFLITASATVLTTNHTTLFPFLGEIAFQPKKKLEQKLNDYIPKEDPCFKIHKKNKV